MLLLTFWALVVHTVCAIWTFVWLQCGRKRQGPAPQSQDLHRVVGRGVVLCDGTPGGSRRGGVVSSHVEHLRVIAEGKPTARSTFQHSCLCVCLSVCLNYITRVDTYVYWNHIQYVYMDVYVHLFHVIMEISVHSVENIPRYTADTVGTVWQSRIPYSAG